MRQSNATNQTLPDTRKGIIDPMKVTLILRAAVIAWAVLTLSASAWGASAKDVFTKVAPSVAVVLALDEQGKTISQGSGVVLGDYEVVTNCHVLGDAADVAVRQAADWSGRETYRMVAYLLARNDERDLCLLFVDQLPEPPAAQAVRLGAAKVLSIGEEVYAVGAPAGLELSLSRGVVSQLRGAFGKRSAPLVQTDAAISPGSSGGGLFNQSGELVGITTFKWRGESLNFALPAEWIEELRAQGRSQLMEARRRIECPKNPNYECVMNLALQEANSIDERLSRAGMFREIGKAQAEAGDLSAAKQSFAAATKAASSVAGTHPALAAATLSNIAAAQVEAGDIAGGLQIAYGFHKVLPRVEALRRIAIVQAKARDEETAKRTFAAAVDAAGSHSQTLIEIALEQAEAGDIAGGIRTVREIQDVEERARALFIITRVQARAGDLQAARRTADSALALEEAHDIEPDAVLFRDVYLNDLATIQAKAGDIAGALSTARDRSDNGLYLFRPKMFLTEHAKTADDIALVIEAAHTIEYAGFRASVLGDIAKKQAALGDRHGSEQTFATALKIAYETDLPKNRALALCDIAAAQTAVGDKQAAKSTFASALEAAHDTDDALDRSWALKEIAVARAKAGDIAAALELTQPIDIPMTKYKGTHEKSGKTFTVELPTDITQEQLKAISEQWDPLSPNSEKALQIAAAQAALCPGWVRGDCAAALREIAAVQAKTGDGAGAMQTFGDAFRAARGIDATTYRSRVKGLLNIATAQLQAGYEQEANRTFATAVKAADHSTAEPDNRLNGLIADKLITGFVVAQVEKGDIAAAVRNARSVEDAGFDSSRLFSEIAVAQAEKGDFKHAMTIAMHIKDAYVRSQALVDIAGRLAAVKQDLGDG